MHREVILAVESFDEEIKIACQASGIEYKDAGEELDNFFNHMKILLEDERMPDITLAELGTFKSTPKSIRGLVYKMKTRIKFGTATKEDLKNLIKKIWYPYKRIIDYNNGKGGVISNIVGAGYFWLYVPMKFTHLLTPQNSGIKET